MKFQPAEIQLILQIKFLASTVPLKTNQKCFSSSNIQYLENDNKILNYENCYKMSLIQASRNWCTVDSYKHRSWV